MVVNRNKVTLVIPPMDKKQPTVFEICWKTSKTAPCRSNQNQLSNRDYQI